MIVSNFATKAQEVLSEHSTITITVPNVSNENGTVIFALHNEDTFMKKAPLQSESVKIVDGVAKVTFSNVAKGTYGITCVHDANDNKRMDFQTNGMPKESYGVSNNPMSFGPPRWDDAKLEVQEDELSLVIRL